MTVTLPMASYNGHPESCLCIPCMTADMDATLTANGLNPADYRDGNGETIGAERTRYATPGTRAGRGVVRLVSARQVAFIRRLLAERDTTRLVRLPGSENIEQMSLAGARDLIDRLLACPQRADAPARQSAPPASDKQIAFIRRLLAERVIPDGADIPAEIDTVSKRAASALIDILTRADYKPRETAKPERAELEAGMYRVGETIYKVQRAVHGSGRMYAKRLVKLDAPYTKTSRGKEVKVTHEFVMASGAITRIRDEHRMTLAEAIDYGAIYGVCCRCAATLTDECSIEAGIGPVCASKI